MAILVNQSRNKTINHSDAKRLSKLEITVTTCEKKLPHPNNLEPLQKILTDAKIFSTHVNDLKTMTHVKKCFDDVTTQSI